LVSVANPTAGPYVIIMNLIAASTNMTTTTNSTITPSPGPTPAGGNQTLNPANVLLATQSQIKLPGMATRFDYLAIDSTRSLLYIAHLGDNDVISFNITSMTQVGLTHMIKSVHGVTAAPDIGLFFATATNTSELVAVSATNFQIVTRIAGAGTLADGLAYAPAPIMKVFVSDQVGMVVNVFSINSLNPSYSLSFRSSIQIDSAGSTTGNVVFDSTGPYGGNGPQILAIAEYPGNAIQFIDPVGEMVTGSMQIPSPCNQSHGLVFDTPSRMAFVSCRNSYVFACQVDAQSCTSGTQIQGTPDVITYDAGLTTVYVAASGWLNALQYNSSLNTLNLVGSTFVDPSVHVVIVDPNTHNVYAPIQNVTGSPALQVYTTIQAHH